MPPVAGCGSTNEEAGRTDGYANHPPGGTVDRAEAETDTYAENLSSGGDGGAVFPQAREQATKKRTK